MKLRIAVIGGGIAGLTAGYYLQRRHQVTLFERSDRLGGNAYTLDTSAGFPVDIGVAAFGKVGYPNFNRLLRELGIRPRISLGSFMSLHNLDTATGFYVTPTLSGLLAQKLNLLRPSQLRSLTQLAHGLTRAREMLEAGEVTSLTLGEALGRIPELSGTPRIALLCVLCLLSSMSGEELLLSPASFFFEKLKIHSDVLSPRAFYAVRCIKGGTRRYVEAMAKGLAGEVVLGADIRAVRREDNGVTLLLRDGQRLPFDRVVFACHADQALGLLEQPTAEESALLGPWRYKDGRVVVHRDHSAFPERPLMQAYTFLYTERESRFETSVNGCLWHLPGVPTRCDYISTQHPNFPIRPELVELETVMRTPIFDFDSCRTIAELPSLNGVRHSYYCGSHFGFGLHEDAIRSAIAVAEALGVEIGAAKA